jgi:hypothetical protein
MNRAALAVQGVVFVTSNALASPAPTTNASGFFEQDPACSSAEPGDQDGTINATWIVSKVNNCTAIIRRPDLV